ncbi:hypothetical protein N9N03_02540 [Chlamydiia bacterium]|nr:hypothetical protein [Chlamydiia bacterium]
MTGMILRSGTVLSANNQSNNKWDIEENTAHRAMDDVFILRDVFRQIVKNWDPYDIAQRANCLDLLVTTERTPEN